jgi:hypothetical protein
VKSTLGPWGTAWRSRSSNSAAADRRPGRGGVLVRPAGQRRPPQARPLLDSGQQRIGHTARGHVRRDVHGRRGWLQSPRRAVGPWFLPGSALGDGCEGDRSGARSAAAWNLHSRVEAPRLRWSHIAVGVSGSSQRQPALLLQSTPLVRRIRTPSVSIPTVYEREGDGSAGNFCFSRYERKNESEGMRRRSGFRTCSANRLQLDGKSLGWEHGHSSPRIAAPHQIDSSRAGMPSSHGGGERAATDLQKIGVLRSMIRMANGRGDLLVLPGREVAMGRSADLPTAAHPLAGSEEASWGAMDQSVPRLALDLTKPVPIPLHPRRCRESLLGGTTAGERVSWRGRRRTIVHGDAP